MRILWIHDSQAGSTGTAQPKPVDWHKVQRALSQLLRSQTQFLGTVTGQCRIGFFVDFGFERDGLIRTQEGLRKGDQVIVQIKALQPDQRKGLLIDLMLVNRSVFQRFGQGSVHRAIVDGFIDQNACFVSLGTVMGFKVVLPNGHNVKANDKIKVKVITFSDGSFGLEYLSASQLDPAPVPVPDEPAYMRDQLVTVGPQISVCSFGSFWGEIRINVNNGKECFLPNLCRHGISPDLRGVEVIVTPFWTLTDDNDRSHQIVIGQDPNNIDQWVRMFPELLNSGVIVRQDELHKLSFETVKIFTRVFQHNQPSYLEVQRKDGYRCWQLPLILSLGSDRLLDTPDDAYLRVFVFSSFSYYVGDRIGWRGRCCTEAYYQAVKKLVEIIKAGKEFKPKEGKIVAQDRDGGILVEADVAQGESLGVYLKVRLKAGNYRQAIQDGRLRFTIDWPEPSSLTGDELIKQLIKRLHEGKEFQALKIRELEPALVKGSLITAKWNGGFGGDIFAGSIFVAGREYYILPDHLCVDPYEAQPQTKMQLVPTGINNNDGEVCCSVSFLKVAEQLLAAIQEQRVFAGIETKQSVGRYWPNQMKLHVPQGQACFLIRTKEPLFNDEPFYCPSGLLLAEEADCFFEGHRMPRLPENVRVTFAPKDLSANMTPFKLVQSMARWPLIATLVE